MDDVGPQILDRQDLSGHEDDLPERETRLIARRVADLASRNSDANDRDGAFPEEDIGRLHRAGLLRAPFPIAMGGWGLGSDPKAAIMLHDVLVELGRGSLSLGRLYEGHINAVSLVARYGTSGNLKLLWREAEMGRPSGVWMAGEALRLEDQAGKRVLRGRKILASGAGYFRRPIVAAEDGRGGSIMVIPNVVDRTRADSSGWIAHGMRSTATGVVDFTGIVVSDEEIVGMPGDYMRPPYFRGGAWRVIAVQLGGLMAILDQYRDQLAESPHRDHPIQLARFGEAAIACETARLWVRQACITAEGPFDDAATVDAYVDLARNAFEAAALRVVGLAQKALGLGAFMRVNPLERIARDLTTYLRQPALDVSLMSAAAFVLARPPAR